MLFARGQRPVRGKRGVTARPFCRRRQVGRHQAGPRFSSVSAGLPTSPKSRRAGGSLKSGCLATSAGAIGGRRWRPGCKQPETRCLAISAGAMTAGLPGGRVAPGWRASGLHLAARHIIALPAHRNITRIRKLNLAALHIPGSVTV